MPTLPRRRGWLLPACLLLPCLTVVVHASPAAGAGFDLNPLAGMRPHPVLTDLAKFRLHTISFFAALILACAFAVKLLWNGLRRDFSFLPRLTYGKALGVVALWGLLFVIVLAMISGARELMTPGAWERREDGGYRLAGTAVGSRTEQLEFVRRRQLESLRDALWKYAQAHGGRFPPHEFVPEVPEPAWLPPHPSGVRYVFVPGRSADAGGKTVAYEPGVFGGDRLALLSDGRIERRLIEDIRSELSAERPEARAEPAGRTEPVARREIR